MGGPGYIFTGENDANVMHNSALINLNIVDLCAKKGAMKVFYSSSACIYPAYNQEDADNPNVLRIRHIQQRLIASMGGRNFSVNACISRIKEIMVSIFESPGSTIFLGSKERRGEEGKKPRLQFAARLQRLAMEEKSRFGEMVSKRVHFYMLMSASRG
jgi:hypothetical protein